MVAAVLGTQLAVSHALFGGIGAELLWLDAGLALLLVVAAFVHIASLTRQRRRLAMIDGVAETFASARSIELTAEAGVTRLVTAGLADAALLAVMRSNASAGEGELMIPVARAGYPDGPTDHRPRSSSDVLPAVPTVSRERLVAEPWLAPLREAAGKRLWVARVPITRGEEALGLLLLASRRKATLGDIALLETVGALFASALDHARLYEAAFERERELEDQDSRRREFLYAIAHELRTPLTSIQASADLLSERRSSLADDSPHLLDSLTRGVERLGSLVDDLLQLGRIEQGGVRVQLAAVDVGEALHAAEAILRPAFMQREQSLRMELPDEPLMAVGEQRSLEQVLLNLLSNANRHTPHRGEVVVHAACKDTTVLIEVQDSGPGIDPLDRARIFEPFYRVQRPGAVVVPGSGLGLAVARRFMELQDGRIWVEDVAGGGSRFCVELASLAEREAAAVPEREAEAGAELRPFA